MRGHLTWHPFYVAEGNRLYGRELVPADRVASSTQKPVADTHALLAIRPSKGVVLCATDAEMLLAVQDLGARGPPCGDAIRASNGTSRKGLGQHDPVWSRNRL